MKILQLCNKLPYPEKDGGAIAINSLTHSLIDAGCTVKMLAMNTTRHFTDINTIPKEFQNKTSLEAVIVDTTVKAPQALLALLSGKSYNISRFNSDDYRIKLESVLKANTYDIVQLEGLYLTPYINAIRQYSKASIVLRAHNVEWIIWEKLAKEAKGFKRLYLKSLTKSLTAYEKRAINECDAITVFTDEDKKQFLEMGCKAPIGVFPFGIDINKYSPSDKPESLSLFFIGALDWMPNIQGLEWFLKEVWNKVHASFPDVKFHVAGRNMPVSLKQSKYPDVHFYGEVENAVSFMNDYGVMVSPLFAGSGIRIKIIEAMALAKPVIATSIAAQGIDCESNKDLVIADTPEDFYLALKRILENPAAIKEIGHNARDYVERCHNVKTITSDMLLFYHKLINGQNR